jgi:hypothetical protein
LRKSSSPILLLVLAAAYLVPSSLAQAPAMPPPNPAYPLASNRTLKYTVDWRVFPAGTASFHLEQKGNNEHVTAYATSNGTMNLLFPVADRYDSDFDRATGCSFDYSKQIQEGPRHIQGNMRLDYARHQQMISERNMINGNTKHLTAPIPGCVTDVLSGIFYAATQPLTVGHDLAFPLADAGKVVTVTMKVEAKESVITPAGTFATIRVEPTAAAGVVKHRGSILIWYTDDARHLPVQVRARLFWGTITMRLASVEGQ